MHGAEGRAIWPGMRGACGNRLHIIDRAGGMPLPEGSDDGAVAAGAGSTGLLLGFTDILPAEAPPEAARLAAVLEAPEMVVGSRRPPNL